VSSIRATKRCAAAAAGVGMVLASFAGAAASATASTSHHASSHHNPNTITPPTGAGISIAVGAPVSVPLATQSGSSAVAQALPTITISDPQGTIVAGTTVTLTLGGTGTTATAPTSSAAGGTPATLTGSPSVTATGATISGSAVVASAPGAIGAGNQNTASKVTFTVASTVTSGTAATYTISGLKLSGALQAGTITLTPSASGGVVVPVAALKLGAVTLIKAAAAGAEAPDTAAFLFGQAFATPTSIVVATDYAPQDAESAAYLAKTLSTGIVLTDPTTLSTAVSNLITATTSIVHVYIVGGTSVVSAGVQASLAALVASRTGQSVTRYAGATQYQTNQTILASTATSGITTVALPYATTAATTYNTSGGASSTTTSIPAGSATAAKAAIVVSGGSDSYQDGIAAGVLATADNLPIVLTESTGLDSGAFTELQALKASGVAQVIVMGGPSAVSDAVVSTITGDPSTGGLNLPVFRVGGTDASDTAQLLARLELSSGTGLSFNSTDGGGILLARGNGFQDALAAAPYAGASTIKTPVLLTENATTLGTPLTSFLATEGPLADFAIQPIGGALSLTPTVLAAASNAEVSGITNP
jgi:putative cell wall-binding protein